MINFASSPFIPALEPEAWESSGAPLRAGVSSFGFGGVNSHVLVQQPPLSTGTEEGSGLFLLSARTAPALRRMCANWESFSTGDEFRNHSLPDILGTLRCGRQHLGYRLAQFVADKAELAGLFGRQLEKALPTAPQNPRPWRLHMGISGLRGFPERPTEGLFNTCLERVLADIGPTACIDTEALYSEIWRPANRPCFNFLTGLALAETFRQLGFKPSLITGEGAGLWVALVVAGMLPAAEAVAHLNGASGSAPVLRRPHTPFSDGDKVWRPYTIDAAYLHALRERLVVDEEGLQSLVATASDLAGSQFTFKKYLEEWAVLLRAAGFDLETMLAAEPANRGGDSARLLLLAVLCNCLMRLHRRWDLSPSLEIGDACFRELDRLVLDEVMPHEVLISFLAKENADQVAMAKILDERQDRLSDAGHFPLLQKCAAWLEQPLADWFIDGPKAARFPAVEDMGCLHLGSGEASSMGKVVALQPVPERRAFLNAVADLWTNGVDLQLSSLVDKPYRTVPLPVYPFAGKSFWLPRKQTPGPGES